jgi:RNA polymerase sigma factor (sigma-70 family)
MNEQDWLAQRFEENRDHLVGVAYRMLGSLAEAEDAVQEAWLRLQRSDADSVENLGGWLTTVVSRICLNVLRSRKVRHETPLDRPDGASEGTGPSQAALPPVPALAPDPEQEAVLADSVGLALLVVLNVLDPAERLAFVLHDMFAVPFDEIGPVVGRTPAAARQLASRARRRIQGTPAVPPADLARQRQVVSAFVAASQGGDFDALVALLDPDVVLRGDAPAVGRTGGPLRGAVAVAQEALIYRARLARLALINGEVGLVVAPNGKLLGVLCPRVRGELIYEIEMVVDPEALGQLEIALLEV